MALTDAQINEIRTIAKNFINSKVECDGKDSYIVSGNSCYGVDSALTASMERCSRISIEVDKVAEADALLKHELRESLLLLNC